jgi:hypothetical protein
MAEPTDTPPVDTTKLRRDVADRMYHVLEQMRADDKAVNWFIEHIEDPVSQLICQLNGHYVIDDMCERPEHRVCLVCHKPMPNEPLAPEPEAT